MDEPELTETELATMREGLRLAARHMRIKGAAKVAAARARGAEAKKAPPPPSTYPAPPRT